MPRLTARQRQQRDAADALARQLAIAANRVASDAYLRATRHYDVVRARLATTTER